MVDIIRRRRRRVRSLSDSCSADELLALMIKRDCQEIEIDDGTWNELLLCSCNKYHHRSSHPRKTILTAETNLCTHVTEILCRCSEAASFNGDFGKSTRCGGAFVHQDGNRRVAVLSKNVSIESRPTTSLMLYSKKHNLQLERLTDILHHFLQQVVNERIPPPHGNDNSLGLMQGHADTAAIQIDSCRIARLQLRKYVARVADMYRDNNAFHNFEHAYQVVMSASKLLNRIVTPIINKTDRCCCVALFPNTDESLSPENVSSNVVLGIKSDPLVSFAILFAALIHDVDHRGLTNDQLIMTQDPLILEFCGKSVAEQNSIRCSWGVLMEDEFKELRHCIYETEEERLRFHQLVINAVLATDIADMALQERRRMRWVEVFRDSTTNNEHRLKSQMATAVSECIIQASDVAHTMQEWDVYLKWNRRLFAERYSAFVAGKCDQDPSIGWFQGELWFFDNYVIPLAKNLGKSTLFRPPWSDEFLMHALSNRQAWEKHGEAIVREMEATCISTVHAA